MESNSNVLIPDTISLDTNIHVSPSDLTSEPSLRGSWNAMKTPKACPIGRRAICKYCKIDKLRKRRRGDAACLPVGRIIMLEYDLE